MQSLKRRRVCHCPWGCAPTSILAPCHFGASTKTLGTRRGDGCKTGGGMCGIYITPVTSYLLYIIKFEKKKTTLAVVLNNWTKSWHIDERQPGACNREYQPPKSWDFRWTDSTGHLEFGTMSSNQGKPKSSTVNFVPPPNQMSKYWGVGSVWW